jgi:hypothetical protein
VQHEGDALGRSKPIQHDDLHWLLAIASFTLAAVQ